MSADDKDLLAAEYVLGTLDDSARTSVRDALPGDPALAAAVRRWESRLTPLEGLSASLEPPPEIWSRIETQLDAEPAHEVETGSTSVRANEGQWALIAPGVEKKVLLIDRAQGFESSLIRMAPGARIPAHAHAKGEECLVIEGEFETDNERYVAGDFFAMSAGTVHPEIVSPTGGVFFLRGEIRHAPRQ